MSNITVKKSRPTRHSINEARVINYSHDSRGIAHIDGKVTFIAQALPDELVRFRYTKVSGRFDEGIATEILEASPDRVIPRCAHFGVCGGCQLQHLHHEKQIEQKQRAVAELLQQARLTLPHWLSPIVAEPWNYRRKARLGLKYIHKKNKQVIGFREHQSSLITDLEQCEVLHESVGKHLVEIRSAISEMSARDQIPQIEIAVDDQETAIIVRHLMKLTETDRQKLRALAQKLNYRLYLQPKGIDSIQLDWPNVDPLMKYTLPEYGLTLQFYPYQFTQVNSAINSLMIRQALTLLTLQSNEKALDLFCGIGNFSLPMAKQCDSVVGVEVAKDAVKQATQNARANHLSNTNFYTADLFKPINHHHWAKQSYDKVLLDPPRSGAQEIIPLLSTWKPKKIVYISCNPATFARDAKLITEQGYTLANIGIIDMFPHTQHVEVMALFQ